MCNYLLYFIVPFIAALYVRGVTIIKWGQKKKLQLNSAHYFRGLIQGSFLL